MTLITHEHRELRAAELLSIASNHLPLAGEKTWQQGGLSRMRPAAIIQSAFMTDIPARLVKNPKITSSVNVYYLKRLFID